MNQPNVDKLVQASAVLLKQEGGHRMAYMRLLKLLYIADRESIKEYGLPITFDRWYALQRGPIVSRVYSLIKGEDVDSPQWAEYIEREKYHVRLVSDPRPTKLSRREIRVLQQVSDNYEDKDEWDLSNLTHAFPEWQKNKPESGASNPIPLEDMLEALGRSEWLEDVREELRERECIERLTRSS